MIDGGPPGTARGPLGTQTGDPEERRAAVRRAARPVAAAEAHVLSVQNAAYRPSTARERHLDALRSGAAAVVTGQQAGLFLGPLYTLYKAAGLRLLGPEGGDVQRLTTPDASRGEVAHAWPRFVPASEALVYTVQTNSSPARALHVRRPDGTTARLLPEVSSSAVSSLANPLLFPQGRARVWRAFDLDRLELAGEPVTVADNLSLYDSGKTYDVVGRVAAFVDFARHTEVAWYDRSGRQIGFRDASWGPGELDGHRA